MRHLLRDGAGFIALFGALAGCAGPELAWYCHTPDRATRVELRHDRTGEWLVIGNHETHRYEVIAADSIAFGPPGHWAFAAIRADRHGLRGWHVVTNEGEEAAWAGIAELQFSQSGRLVYAAQHGRRWRVVLDGRSGPLVDALVENSITFSPDGGRVGYVGVDGACQRIIIDALPGPCEHSVIAVRLANSSSFDAFLQRTGAHDDVRLVVGGEERARFESAKDLTVDPSVHHWAVVASRGGESRWHVAVDGQDGPTFDEIGEVTWAPDGREVAYTARHERAWFVVRGEAISRAYVRVESPVFSADATRLAFIGRTITESEVVLDGKTLWHAPTEATALRFDPQGDELAWVYRGLRGATLAIGGRRYSFDIVVEGTLRFSRDGRHWAALVGDRSERRLFIVVDGERKLPFDTVELFGGGLGSGDAPLRQLGSWVDAELSRYLASRSPT